MMTDEQHHAIADAVSDVAAAMHDVGPVGADRAHEYRHAVGEALVLSLAMGGFVVEYAPGRARLVAAEYDPDGETVPPSTLARLQ